MNLPSDDDIKNLHKKLAKDEKTFTDIYTHCQIVADIAQELTKNLKLKVDEHLMHTGAMLHDVGAYTFDDIEVAFKKGEYITHAIRGYEVLQNEGFDDAICQIVLNHIGMGVTKKNIETLNLPLPLRDYEPTTIEQKLVMYADKFHSKSKQPTFNSARWYKNHVARFGADHVQKFESYMKEFGLPDLEMLSKKYNQPIRDL